MDSTKNYDIYTSKDNKYGTCGTMIYTDPKCRIEFDVCDYRDPVWWITVLKKFNLTKEQKIELLRRISANVQIPVYEERIGEIQEDINNIDGSKSIIDY
jgi:hypothetical protein